MIILQPQLSDVRKWYESKGLVGEGRLSILQTLLAIKKQPFGIESLAGAGKSATLDLLANHKLNGEEILLPKESVYIMGVGSKTAQMYKEAEINKAKLIYVEELQKAGSSLEITEMLKNLAEGKEFTRDVTDMAGGSVKTQKILKGKGIMYTLAIENKHKNDEEMKRRFIVMSTDVSQEQTKKVVTRKAQERFAKERLVEISEEEIDSLRRHIKGCLELDNIKFQNPYAEALSEYMPTPDQKVRSFVGHYFNVVDAVSLYHYKDRLMTSRKDGKTDLFVTIQDVYVANLLYNDYFTMDIHSIPPLGKEILLAFNKIDYENTLASKEAKKVIDLSSFSNEEDTVEHRWATVTDIHDYLKKEMNIVLKHGVTRDVCNQLYEAGFLSRNSKPGAMNEYCLADSVESLNSKIDWSSVLEAGKKLMKEHKPQHYEEWMKTQELQIINPLTDKQVNILEKEIINKPPNIITKPQEVEIVMEDLNDEHVEGQWSKMEGVG